MKGGTIVLRSGGELRTGAWMRRGTIISLKPIRFSQLPLLEQLRTDIPRHLARQLDVARREHSVRSARRHVSSLRR
jgi:hypothetical protein